MNKITIGKLFEFYVDTFNKFGVHILKETDQMIEYYVLEQTDINVGYCSNRILVKFLEEGMIDDEIYERSMIFLKEFRRLESTMLIRNANTIKNSLEWKRLLEISDNIKEMIKNKWTDEELKVLFSFEQPVNLEIYY